MLAVDYWRRACEISRAQRVRSDEMRTEVGGLIVETIK
jgi:hypothetical protein